MRGLHRRRVNKKYAAKKFRHHVRHAKAVNFAIPMRGGFRI